MRAPSPPDAHWQFLLTQSSLAREESQIYEARWRRRKTELYTEVCAVRSELDGMKQTIEQHRQAWLRDLALVSSMLKPQRPA